MRSRLLSSLLFLLLAALPAAPADAALAKRGGEVSTADACNPHPDKDDIVLPMPGGLSMAFRLVAVPSKGLLWDMSARPGRDDAANSDRAFYDRRYRAFLSAPFSRADLPSSWRAQAPAGDYFFYLVAKYEVSLLQWQSIMGSGTEAPVTDISWYEAVEFTRRYTEWLLQNAADALPRYAGDSRNVGFVRLPTETEWEYAARGGQTAGPEQLMEKDFFALPAGAPLADYAVYRPEGAARIAEDCARIGSRKPNPAGFYDMAGNAAEMVQDGFQFSLGGRLHGSTGGFIRKGGGFLSTQDEVMPGRREEVAPFLKDGPNKARDLGFRIALSGINTPGGARPAELASEWKKAGIELSAELNPSGDPLELVAPLEARAGSDAEKASLKGLQNLIRENNISLERQKRSTVSNEIRSAVYLVTMLKDCLIKREIIGKELQNFEDKKKQITAALPKMKAAEANQYKQVLASLDKGIALSKTGIGNQEAEFRSMLLFYKQTVENTRKVPQSLFDEELKGIGQEMSGKAPHLVKQNASLQIYRKHVAALRGGKLALLSSDALRKDILSLIPKGK